MLHIVPKLVWLSRWKAWFNCLQDEQCSFGEDFDISNYKPENHNFYFVSDLPRYVCSKTRRGQNPHSTQDDCDVYNVGTTSSATESTMSVCEPYEDGSYPLADVQALQQLPLNETATPPTSSAAHLTSFLRKTAIFFFFLFNLTLLYC